MFFFLFTDNKCGIQMIQVKKSKMGKCTIITTLTNNRLFISTVLGIYNVFELKINAYNHMEQACLKPQAYSNVIILLLI